MTAPEIMNSSATVDGTTDPAQTVRNQNLQVVVERAQDQLRQLTLQRQEIAQRIAMIKRTISGLVLLHGGALQRGPLVGTIGKRRRGLTNACRVVLNQANTPLSAREVCAAIREEFPELFRQPGDSYASLVTILNRLAKYGEADTFLRNGSRFWQRHQPPGHRGDELLDA